jgi:hypothetical protein
VLTAIGLKLGHIENAVLDVVLFTMILSAVAGTYLTMASHPVYLKLRGLFGRERVATEVAEEAGGHGHGGRAIVLLGFHRIASALLHEIETSRPDLVPQVLVVDFNPVVLDGLRKRGVACSYGDLANPDTLHHAGIAGAKVALCTIPDTLLKGTSNRRILGHVRAMVPDAKLVGTAETAAVEKDLVDDGATAVIVPQRAAAASAFADVLALLEGRPPPSAAATAAARREVLA